MKDVNKEEAIRKVGEPWLPVETKLVRNSLIIGFIALIVLATLVNIFILGV
jgi:hypothetical protein